MSEDNKVVYNAEEIVFPQAWPFKTKDKSHGVTLGTIVGEMADISNAVSQLKGFDETEWAVAQLPPGILEWCIDEAVKSIDKEYEEHHGFSKIVGPLSLLDGYKLREVYCLWATRRALLAVKEEESKKKHTRSGDTTVVVVEDDDTTGTAAVIGESPEKRAKKVDGGSVTASELLYESHKFGPLDHDKGNKMSDDLP
jgi:hypothetical protein